MIDRWFSSREVDALKVRIQDLEALIATYSNANASLREENEALTSAIIFQSYHMMRVFNPSLSEDIKKID